MIKLKIINSIGKVMLELNLSVNQVAENGYVLTDVSSRLLAKIGEFIIPNKDTVFIEFCLKNDTE